MNKASQSFFKNPSRSYAQIISSEDAAMAVDEDAALQEALLLSAEPNLDSAGGGWQFGIFKTIRFYTQK